MLAVKIYQVVNKQQTLLVVKYCNTKSILILDLYCKFANSASAGSNNDQWA